MIEAYIQGYLNKTGEDFNSPVFKGKPYTADDLNRNAVFKSPTQVSKAHFGKLYKDLANSEDPFRYRIEEAHKLIPDPDKSYLRGYTRDAESYQPKNSYISPEARQKYVEALARVTGKPITLDRESQYVGHDAYYDPSVKALHATNKASLLHEGAHALSEEYFNSPEALTEGSASIEEGPSYVNEQAGFDTKVNPELPPSIVKNTLPQRVKNFFTRNNKPNYLKPEQSPTLPQQLSNDRYATAPENWVQRYMKQYGPKLEGKPIEEWPAEQLRSMEQYLKPTVNNGPSLYQQFIQSQREALARYPNEVNNNPRVFPIQGDKAYNKFPVMANTGVIPWDLRTLKDWAEWKKTKTPTALQNYVSESFGTKPGSLGEAGFFSNYLKDTKGKGHGVNFDEPETSILNFGDKIRRDNDVLNGNSNSLNYALDDLSRFSDPTSLAVNRGEALARPITQYPDNIKLTDRKYNFEPGLSDLRPTLGLDKR